MSKHTIFKSVEVFEEETYGVRISGRRIDRTLENRREIEKRINIFPEMLEALKDTLNCIYEMSKGREDPVDTGVIASAEAVIKKAEGA